MNGKLDDPAWQNAPWTDYFQDIEGGEKTKPRFKTRAKMLWDEDYFYIGADLEEPQIWATLTKRDSVIFYDNDFEVFIDPDSDNHQYYEFEMNALNTVWDLRLPKPYKDGGSAIDSWDIEGLKTAVHVDGVLNNPNVKNCGWSLEIAMPWKALREFSKVPAPPKHGDQWRVNFSRVEWEVTVEDGKFQKAPNQKEDNWVWSPQEVVDMHRPERWGYVQFSTSDPKSDRFRRDISHEVRAILHEIYYAQHDFHAKNKQFAPNLQSLNLNFTPTKNLQTPPEITLTKEGFWATMALSFSKNRRETWNIQQDALIRKGL